jgi:hypothetical protein
MDSGFRCLASWLSFIFIAMVASQEVITRGAGYGTYYYDVLDVARCGSDFTEANQGPVECSPNRYWTLNDVHSNYLVAMNHTQLAGDLGRYCGKKVMVAVNGIDSGLPLFIGDGCVRCAMDLSPSSAWNADGSPGLDLSYGVAETLASSVCDTGHIEISWEIVDELVYQFDPSEPGTSPGLVAGTTASDDGTMQPSSTTAVPTASAVSGCENNAWRCTADETSLEQCVDATWMIRDVCPSGFLCQGGSNPYCVETSQRL